MSARTLRKDRWWVGPLLTTLGLAGFVSYATVRVFQQNHYWVAEHHYLTPFYSPCLSANCAPGSAVFGTLPWEFPWFLPYALFTLPFLLLFRFTCYYYRKAYYRSIWQAPTACAVQEPHQRYTGESRFPMLGQNLHRYFFYAAVLISLINTYDAAVSFAYGTNGGFGIGVGNLVLLANVILLWCYTLSCHSCRHVFGGRLKSFGRHPLQYRLWTWISVLNTRHMTWAWITLGTLVLTDLYVALVSSGVLTDLRIIN
ncbi:membrane protein [Salinactinospora qingdaonensis]|uniref:Membrane protein n=2 Tax=Salinactinospora qingdaonensis TaxID=702744 RepID=A0ABP7FQ34_9ACTN